MSARPSDVLSLYDQAERVAGIGSFEYRLGEGTTIWSDNLFRLYGLDPDMDGQLEGEAFAERVHPADRGALDDMLAQMGRGGTYGADLRFRRFDGVERVIELRGESELDEAGGLARAVGTARDVTEARATEDALRESRQRLQEAMRVAEVGSFEGRPDTGEFEWSDELFRLYGMDPQGPPWSGEEWAARMEPAVNPAMPVAPQMGPFSFEQGLRRADGALRQYEVRGEAYDEGGERHMRGTVRDVTLVRRGEAERAAVADLTRRALEGLALDQLLQLACEGAASALDAEAVGVLEPKPDGSFVITAAHGVEPHLLGGDPSAPGAALAREALDGDAPVIVGDWHSERPEFEPARLGDLEVHSSMAVPIRAAGRPFGALSAGSVAKDRFGRDSTDFLLSMANVLAASIERNRHEHEIEVLAEQRGRLVAQTLEAEERVRRRVSEAIHDGSLQDLLAARQDLVEAGEGHGDDARGLLNRGREGIERAVGGLRQAVQDLHPVVLQHAGLEAALMAAADHAAGTGGFVPRVSVDPQACGPRDDLVLSLARELLANAAKHAGAGVVTVTVAAGPAGIALEVADDGAGMGHGRVADAPRGGHIGLASVAERVEAIGGTLEIVSEPGAGTAVKTLLPLPPA